MWCLNVFNPLFMPVSFEQCKTEVARKHGLGNSLVTGHRAAYFAEAAEMYASQFQLKEVDISQHNYIGTIIPGAAVYLCPAPNCNYPEILHKTNYCPNCGVKLNWIK